MDYFPQGTFKPQLNMKRFVILHLQQLTLKNQKFAYETRSSVSVIIGTSYQVVKLFSEEGLKIWGDHDVIKLILPKYSQSIN